MALPLPIGKKIHILYRLRNNDQGMASMEAAPDHYALGFMVHGDRRVITPTMTYSLHPGYVNALAPYQYHKTIPTSNEYYENILIKFSPDFLKPFNERLGSHIIEKIFEYPPKTFAKETQGKIFQIAREMYDIYDEHERRIAEGAGDKHGNSTDYLEFKLQNMLYEMLLLIYENMQSNELGDIYNTPLSKPILEAVYYMEQNYMKPLKIEDVAKISNYSISYFSRMFQAQLGTAFSDYLNTIRLKHVQDALLSSNQSITEIALENGFSYPGNMTNSFRKQFGMTPMQYRKKRLDYKPSNELIEPTNE